MCNSSASTNTNTYIINSKSSIHISWFFYYSGSQINNNFNIFRKDLNAVLLERLLGRRFHSWVPLYLKIRCPIMYTMCSFRRYMPLKLPLSCEVVQKQVVLVSWFVEGGNTPDFGHAFSNYTYFRPCGQIWLSSVQRARRLAEEKKKERKKKAWQNISRAA